jgi:enamine deaminase RidA (YjgF/YER057c/UK114 family)
MNDFDLRHELDRLGLTLPPVPPAVADYRPAVVAGGLVWVSGQLPIRDGELIATGPVPRSTTVQAASAAARIAGLNALAAIDDTLDGDWQRVQRVARLEVFVASDPGFTDQHRVADGASELLGEVLGQRGRHARAAVGVMCLPLGSPVELQLVVALRDQGRC